MARLASLRIGLAFAHAGNPTSNTSPLYSVSLFALMTTIMTDIERPHYNAISPLALSTFVSCFSSGSVLHSHEQASFDDERSWAHLGSTCNMQAHLLMRFLASLSMTGPSWSQSANSFRTEHQTDCSARKHALGRTYSGRSFLEEEQHLVFTEHKRLIHCAYFHRTNLWRRSRNEAFG